MTISTDRTHEFTIDEIVTYAYRLAGLLNASQSLSTEKLAAGRAAMQMALDSLEAEGLFSRTADFEYITCADGTQSYSVPASVVAVVGQAQYLPAGESQTTASTEYGVFPISREEWAAISPKDGEGTPTKYWFDRLNRLLWLDPIPDEAGQVRLHVQRFRASSLTGSSTPDVEKFWANYLRWQVAHDIAAENSRNISFLQYAQQQAESFKARATAAARPQNDTQFYIPR